MAEGPAAWTDFPFRHEGLWLNGVQIEAGAAYPLVDLDVLNGSRLLLTAGSTEILQRKWLGGQAPVGVRSTAVPVQFTVKNEADYRLFVKHAQRGDAVELFMDWPLIEEWYIPAKAAGQTEWQPARKFPWDLTGINHTTRPPRVYIDDVAQTIVTTGTPATGEAKVPVVGGFDVLTMPSDITGTWLRIEYAPVLTCLVAKLGQKYAEHNRLDFAAEIVEQQARRFT